MKILITGGSGFIGSYIVKKFLSKKHTILNLDKLSTFSQKLNIKSKNYIFKKIDLLDKKKLMRIFNNFSPDIVINAAAESHVDRSIVSPSYFFENNLIGTINILNLCKKRKKIKLIHISTDEVFGSLKKNEKKFTSSSNYDPRSPYSASKAASDHAVRSYGETYNLNFNITNCSNNYGPFQYPEKLIPVVILSCMNNTQIPVYGNGLNIRDWIHVSDHVEAIYEICFSKFNRKTFLIGGNNEVSNINIIKLICKEFDKINKSKNSKRLIRYVKDRAGHDFRYAINNREIYSKLEWRPKIKFHQGLRETILFYMKNHKNFKNLFIG